MKIEKTDIKVVQIRTGSVVSPTHVETFTPYLAEKETRTFYSGSRLTKDGNPPKNASWINWNDEVRWDQDGDPRGKVAVYNKEREAEAGAIRENIERIERELAREKLTLHTLYAGPRPNTHGEDLRKAFKEQ